MTIFLSPALEAILNAPPTPAKPAAVPAPAPAIPAAAAPAASAPPASGAGRPIVSQDFLSNLLSQFPQAAAASQEKGPSLLEVLDSRALIPLVQEPAVRDALLPLLPEIDRTPHGLRAFLTSPQFQQAVQAFDAAVRAGHMQNILRQLGANEQVQDTTTIGSFLKSIEKSAKK